MRCGVRVVSVSDPPIGNRTRASERQRLSLPTSLTRAPALSRAGTRRTGLGHSRLGECRRGLGAARSRDALGRRLLVGKTRREPAISPCAHNPTVEAARTLRNVYRPGQPSPAHAPGRMRARRGCLSSVSTRQWIAAAEYCRQRLTASSEDHRLFDSGAPDRIAIDVDRRAGGSASAGAIAFHAWS